MELNADDVHDQSDMKERPCALMWTGRGQHGDQNLGIWIQVSDFFELPSTRSFVTRLLRVMEETKYNVDQKLKKTVYRVCLVGL